MTDINKKDIFDVLSEFYGKILEPRFNRIENTLDDHGRKFRDLLDHFDRIYTKFDQLETEYYSITASIDRIEKRLDKGDGR